MHCSITRTRDFTARPRELERVVARCLRKDPERRFQTATDVRNRNWKVLRDGIYLLDSQTNAQLGTAARVADARFYRFADEEARGSGLPNLESRHLHRLDLSADAKWVYYRQVDSSTSELHVVKNLPSSERRR